MARLQPSYFKAAFANVYNLSAFGAVLAAAAGTGDWALAGLGVAAEALWLLFSTQSDRFRRAVDAHEAQAEKLREQEALERRAAELPAAERVRLQALRMRVAELKAEARREPATAGDFMAAQLERLDGLVGDYLRLAITAQRARTYLDRTDARALNRDREAHRRMESGAADAEGRDLARQNREVLEKRLAVVDELQRFLERARAQMTLVENSVGLVRDQLAALKEPGGVGGELDRIVASVEALREATRSAERLVGTPEPAASEAAPVQIEDDAPVSAPRGRARTRE